MTEGLDAQETAQYVAQLVTSQLGGEGFVLHPEQVRVAVGGWRWVVGCLGCGGGVLHGGLGGFWCFVLGLGCRVEVRSAGVWIWAVRCCFEPSGRPTPPCRRGVLLCGCVLPQVTLISARDALVARTVINASASEDTQRRFIRLAFGTAKGANITPENIVAAAQVMLQVRASDRMPATQSTARVPRPCALAVVCFHYAHSSCVAVWLFL